MCLGVPLLCVDEVGELGWVSDEEHRCVVEHLSDSKSIRTIAILDGTHPIEVTLICLQLDRKSTRITSSIGRARLTTNRRETNGGANFFAYRFEESGRGDVTNVMGHFKVSMSTRTLGMNLKYLTLNIKYL